MHLALSPSSCPIVDGGASTLIKRLTSLNVAKLYLYEKLDVDGHFTKRCNIIVKMVEVVNHVNCLKLAGVFMEALSNATRNLSVKFERLTELDIITTEYCQWKSLSVMLDCSINLKVLKVEWAENSRNERWVDPKHIPKCLSSSLEEISISGFTGLTNEMEMIRFVLKHGEVIRRIKLEPSDECVENKFQMLRKISTFPRSSRTCVVQFD
ncbi:OLC1v1000375C1 [Oldenlandia corymbosa var. corymbosa]|uniref:OLC1v1000375C1 n=1 Tax=Oldenlandia corymbosa var. corymbosa TaxID=529605 RepID=A0AAV1D3N9_OLDCO|nr:OLC1v1000375C1 [Oldenlandia corymbosa var. corymbosa]